MKTLVKILLGIFINVSVHALELSEAESSGDTEDGATDELVVNSEIENLKNEIKATINNNPKHVAYWFYRKFMFQKERLRFSGWQTDKNYRLFRKSKVNFSSKRIVHETLDIVGSTGILKNKLTHYCFKDYKVYKNKMMLYGRLKAKEAFNKNKRFSYALLLLKPMWKFFNSYIIRLGFLDGKKGVVICHLDALCDVERYRELQRLEREEQWSTVFKTIP